MAELHELTGPNQAYVLDLYERYLVDPQSVDEGWRAFFASYSPPADVAPAAAPAPAGGARSVAAIDVEKVVAARELARSIRARGHTAARLDPLDSETRPDPVLEASYHGVTDDDLAALPATVVYRNGPDSATALEEIRRLRHIYAGTVGYEFLHLPDPRERGWLREAIESGRYDRPLDDDGKRALLERLSRVEGFERFLHRTFFGQKRFSIEGTDTLVPILDEIIAGAAAAGADDVIIGMAHRGRLNVLTHVLRKPYSMMLAGFQSAQAAPGVDARQNSDEPSGDVKYHMGWRDEREIAGHRVRLSLAPNPSHLEFVNPVVVGMTRAAQDETHAGGEPPVFPERALAVLIHGDAAFPGQGVVPETFNMACLPGYRSAARSTSSPTTRSASPPTRSRRAPPATRATWPRASRCRWCTSTPTTPRRASPSRGWRTTGAGSSLPQGLRDRPGGLPPLGPQRGRRAALHAAGDVRRHPRTPTVREICPPAGGRGRRHPGGGRRRDAAGRARRAGGGAGASLGPGDRHAIVDRPSPNGRPTTEPETGVAEETLRELNDALLRRPEGFTPNARLEKQLERRRDALDGGGIDWGHAEALAFASILADGTPIRLTGQDVERGTFSHRHRCSRFGNGERS
jgi:2-oxoglutarate dehydrogenase E1 component